MSDNETKTRKPRSPINALKVLNILRGEKGLPKVKAKLPGKEKVGLSREERAKLTQKIWGELYPEALSKDDYVLPAGAEQAVLREFVKRTK